MLKMIRVYLTSDGFVKCPCFGKEFFFWEISRLALYIEGQFQNGAFLHNIYVYSKKVQCDICWVGVTPETVWPLFYCHMYLQYCLNSPLYKIWESLYGNTFLFYLFYRQNSGCQLPDAPKSSSLFNSVITIKRDYPVFVT